jgi:mRNA-degrading endonuclease RelE of RelBE toxin-antitoxin system
MPQQVDKAFANSDFSLASEFAISEYTPVELVIEKDAARRLRDLARKRQIKLLETLERIAADPFADHANVKPLKGYTNTFPYRLGDWRAVYVIDVKAQQMRVTRIGPRGGVYE